MAPHSFMLYTLLIFTSSLYEICTAVNYEVINDAPNTPGGINFNKFIGIPYTKEEMGKINNFIWSTIFKQNTPADRKPIATVKVFITLNKGGPESLTWDTNKINVSVVYLTMYKGDALKPAFTSLLYREMTRVFQWQGNGKAPKNLLEGIADYTVLRAKLNLASFAKPGSGSKWDEGNEITARFLEYCERLALDFVAKLNDKMRNSYDVSFFQMLTGKPVDQLWKEYKAKYAGKQGVDGIIEG